MKTSYGCDQPESVGTKNMASNSRRLVLREMVRMERGKLSAS